MRAIICFGCYSTEPCKCSDSWKRFCRYARDQAWQVKLPILDMNLRIAAALCRAFTIGGAVWLDAAMGVYLYQWRPGCGRSAP